MPATSTSARRIERLDSIRFVAALWVALGHGAVPLKPLSDVPIVRTVLTAIGSSFCGLAAVMVFFIVSGLCIHLPYSGKKSVPLLPFLIRRYVRIGLPLLSVLAAAHLLGPRSVEDLQAVIWSVFAELFYYSIYPLMFRLAVRVGWLPLIAGSACVAAGIALMNMGATHPNSFGWWVWLWGLPVWLSGCLLADLLRQRRIPSVPGPLWAWRATLWAASVAAIVLVFHSPIRVGYQFSMLAVSALAFGWLLKELQNPQPGWPALERLGAASYSLYLVHNVVLGSIHGFLAPLSPLSDIAVRTVGITAATFTLYYLVEAPSHRLARRLASAVAKATSVPGLASNPISG